jgi:hypothetical protein
VPTPTRPVPAPVAAPDPFSIADVTERLMAEFSGLLDCASVSRTVLACRHELLDAPPAALPELVERLARQRLLDGADGDADAGTG